jgi:multicomponent Na+:H+ antiporter subunit B
VRLRSLFATAMLTGIYSFLGASWMLLLDAPDVAFTEAAVGAGISTVVLLVTLSLTTREEKPCRFRVLPLLVVVATGAALIYATLDMPAHGDPNAPAHGHVAPEYIADVVPTADGEIVPVGIDNVVTTVLASYRGYDTLGETAVIFTAGIGVLLLLRRRSKREEETS